MVMENVSPLGNKMHELEVQTRIQPEYVKYRFMAFTEKWLQKSPLTRLSAVGAAWLKLGTCCSTLTIKVLFVLNTDASWERSSSPVYWFSLLFLLTLRKFILQQSHNSAYNLIYTSFSVLVFLPWLHLMRYKQVSSFFLLLIFHSSIQNILPSPAGCVHSSVEQWMVLLLQCAGGQWYVVTLVLEAQSCRNDQKSLPQRRKPCLWFAPLYPKHNHNFCSQRRRGAPSVCVCVCVCREVLRQTHKR